MGQINSLLQEYDIIPIFAAEATARGFYEVLIVCISSLVIYVPCDLQGLTQVLTTAFVGTLAADSSNIVELIQETYNVSIILSLCRLLYSSLTEFNI